MHQEQRTIDGLISDLEILIVELKRKRAQAEVPGGCVPTERSAPAQDISAPSVAPYRMLVDGVLDYAIFFLTPEGKVASWNKGAERTKGYTSQEIIGQSFTLFYLPQDILVSKPQRLLKEAAEQGRVEDEGWRLRKDGTRFWADVVITAIRDDEGTLLGYTKVTRDLTARKQAEDQQKLFELLVTSVSDYAIMRLNTDGKVASWNRGVEQVKGYTEEEIIGLPYERFFLPEDVAKGKPCKLLQQARELGHIEDEGWRLRKDGSRFWADAVITALYDATGEFVGYAKVTRDLTERRLAEQQQKQFELLVKGVLDYAIFMLDPRGRIVSWNRGAEKLKGYSEAEIIGECHSRFYTQADLEAGKPQELLKKASERGHAQEEGWRVRKDGTRFWADVVITAIRDDEGTLVGYSKVTRDLTERKQAETMKDQFFGILSHELRTPLNAILGFGSLLEDEVPGALNPEQSRYVKRMLGSADILLTLINDLLDLSRIQAGKFSILPEPIAFDDVAEQVAANLHPLAEQKSQILQLEIDPGLPTLKADPQRLNQVLVNLIGNAIKFTPDGGSIRVKAFQKGDQVVCMVSDNGIGIAVDDFSKLFKPFSQLDSSNTRRAGGTGLGLSISKALVEAHGGSIGVESATGQGSTFWFSMPLTGPVSIRNQSLEAPAHWVAGTSDAPGLA